MTIAIIPARGGSKRIPHKNIKLFSGKPIISYSITAARASGVFTRIMVSTDSDLIAEVAQEFGAEVPFKRPLELADDHTPTAPVILHALEWLTRQGEPAEYACCIYPTAPFLQPQYLRQGYELLRNRKVSSVFSVTTFPFPIFRALKINDQGCLEMFWPEHELIRSQDLPEAYHDAGQFYWLNCKIFLQERRIYGKDALPVVLPRYLVQDIDTLEDWERAELMFQAWQGSTRKEPEQG
jgi:pseudaminic acid cytidylyltransferase